MTITGPAWICPTSSANTLWWYSLGVLRGLLTLGVEMSVTLFLALGSLTLPLSCLNRPLYEDLCLVLTATYYDVWLISPGGLLFFEGKWTRIWGRREVGWVGRSEAKENCSSDVICERGIIFFFKKKSVILLTFLQRACEAGCGDHWGTDKGGHKDTRLFRH